MAPAGLDGGVTDGTKGRGWRQGKGFLIPPSVRALKATQAPRPDFKLGVYCRHSEVQVSPVRGAGRMPCRVLLPGARESGLSGKLRSPAPPKDHLGLLCTFIKCITNPQLDYKKHSISPPAPVITPCRRTAQCWSGAPQLSCPGSLQPFTIYSFSTDVSAGRDTQRTMQMHSSPALH